MKKLSALIVITLLLVACHKKSNDGPAKPVPSIYGSWLNNDTDELKPVFSNDTLYWEDYHGIILTGYTETIEFHHDTILETFTTGAFPELLYTYKVNATNDTLTLSDYGFTPYKADTLIYWRVITK